MGTSPDPLVGTTIDGRYQVEERIARGGMAAVYRARDSRLDRDVALKVLYPYLAESKAFVDRFRREARAAARLVHPGIVGMFDQGTWDDSPYLVMEFVDGPNLRTVLASSGVPPLGKALDLMGRVLDALAAAHRAGFIHRDVKPENVLISKDGRQVKVADFGLARTMTEVTAASTGTVLGTVAYLAPELVADGTADARADVYAAGVVLFEILTGSQPFTGEAIQVAFQHVNSQVPAPSTRAAGIPPALDRLVLHMTAKDPAQRPADAGAALRELRDVRASLTPAQLEAVPSPVYPPFGGAPQAEPAASAAPPAPTTRRAIRAGATPDPAAAQPTAVVAPVPTGRRDDGTEDASITTFFQREPENAPQATTPLHRFGRKKTARTGPPASDSARPPQRRRWILAAVAAVVVVALGIGGYSIWYHQAGPGERIAVPQLVGSSRDVAVARLAQAQLDSDVTEQFSDTISLGLVIAQSEKAGTRVSRHTKVTLTVSRGIKDVTVPAGLTGSKQAAAVKSLAKAGFDVPPTITESYSTTVAKGLVMGVLPAESTQAAHNAKVTLTVSRGPEPVTMPTLTGLTLAAAQNKAQADDITVTQSGKQYSETVPSGKVVSQSIAAGGTAHRGDSVTVVISRGMPLVAVPDVSMKDPATATATLTQAGFKVQQTGTPFLNLVQRTDPPAGQKARKGSTITLYLV